MKKLLYAALLLVTSLTACGQVANAQDPHFLEAAKGNVPGLSGTTIIGSNEALGATEQTVWMASTAYTYPTTGLLMTAVSTSAADVLGGAGAEVIRITYLTTALVEQTTTIDLAGLTPVAASVSDVFRINAVEVAQSANGANTAFNVGDIVIASAGTTYGFIEANETRSLSTVYTVPKDKIAYIYYLAVSCDSGKSVQFSLILREPGEPPHVHGHIEAFQASATRFYDIPVRVIEGTDIEVRGLSSAAGTHVEATYSIFLVDR